MLIRSGKTSALRFDTMKNKEKKEIRDCHYCEHCVCESPTSKDVHCYNDSSYFDHTIKSPKNEANKCKFFEYSDSFPKY